MADNEKKSGEKKEGLFKRAIHLFYDKKQSDRYSYSKIGKMRVHNISDPKLMRPIFRDMEHFGGIQFVRNTFKKLIGNGLIMDEGESWEKMHKVLMPSFNPTAVEKTIAPIALEECNRMLDRWEKQGKVVDIEKEMKDMTGRVIMRSIFGDAITDKDGETIINEIAAAMGGAKQPKGFGKILRKLNVPYDHAGFIPPLVFRVLGVAHDRPASVPKPFLEATKKVDKILYKIIAERRKLAVQPDDILGRLINAQIDGKPLPDKEIRDQALMVVVTGHETTAEGMTFSLLELLKNPDAQKRLRDEFNTVVTSGKLTGRDIGKLPKAQNAFKEALRMHPTVYMSTREVTEDIELGGIKFKKHDIIRMDLREVHKDKELWNEPEKFKPERFDKEKFPQAFMPFGTGPRVCLGMNMSLMEGTLMLSQIFNRIDIKVDRFPEGEEYYFTTRPKGKLDVTVTKHVEPVQKPDAGAKAPPTP